MTFLSIIPLTIILFSAQIPTLSVCGKTVSSVDSEIQKSEQKAVLSGLSNQNRRIEDAVEDWRECQ
jgi:hypothetical protein